jgi:putative glutathione S-transferase
MGLLIDGQWHDQWYDTSKDGKFKRKDSTFRNTITNNNSGDSLSLFTPEKNRYHLYISLACPWAHRALIFRKLKGLEDIISLSVVNPYMGENGWTFEPGSGVIPDPENNFKYLHQIYTAADKKYTGRVTVPVLWDKKTKTIVNNESAEIIRIFNKEFNSITNNQIDYYPTELQEKIDSINDYIYSTVNNGVYKAGFATTQSSYREAVIELFIALDKIEEILANNKYLVGDKITEADWRLFTTLIRFDPVYVGHFKTNLKCLHEYDNLWNYTKELYQMPGIAQTVDFDHIKQHYYKSHRMINPTGIVPEGPVLDLMEAHNR